MAALLDDLFEPDPARVALLEAGWRENLGASLSHIGDVLDRRGQTGREQIELAAAALRAGPVSPWVTCLYSRLVVELAASDAAAVERTLGDIVDASRLEAAPTGPLTLDDKSVPESWWLQFGRLLDTDKQRVFQPVAPDRLDEQACRDELDAALALLRDTDSDAHHETTSLARLIVLGARSSDEPDQRFGAVSTFFMPATVLLNARVRRSPIEFIDLLVHEAAHLMLFGLCRDGSLIEDDGSNRYVSAARADPRPLDGIFHACFVSTRVHRTLQRILETKRLSARDREDANRESARNRQIAAQTLATLQEHARPTGLGGQILEALAAYWARVETQAHAA